MALLDVGKLDGARFPESDFARIEALSLPSVRFRVDSEPSRMLTRLGGDPDLPAGTEWPTWNGLPLAFLAQMDLSEVTVAGSGLPAAGLLSFFFAGEQAPSGMNPSDRGAARVLYFSDIGGLIRRPSPDEPFIPQQALIAAGEVTYASVFSAAFEALDLPELAIRAVAGATVEADRPAHRFLGHEDALQGEMRVACELVSRGLSGIPRRPLDRDVETVSSGWRLLMQVDSDWTNDIVLGDLGRVYFWIRSEDLIEKRWERVLHVLQA